MKFNVTNIIDVASSLTADNFELLVSGCTTVVVDIRNPSATVANLKAAAVVKLKVKDPLSLRLVAVFSSSGSESRRAQAIDELESDRKAVLTSVFLSVADTPDIVQLYALRASEASPSPAYASEVQSQECKAMHAIAVAGKLIGSAAASPSPATPTPTPTPQAQQGDDNGRKEGSVGATKRGREEGADDADRSALVVSPNQVTGTQQANTVDITPRAASTPPANPAPTVPAADDAEWEDASNSDKEDDDNDDDDGDAGGFEEGDEWGTDDDDGIEWVEGMGLDHLGGLVPELAPAERELVTELISLPNAGSLIQKVMEGKAAEAMAEVQTANPRLFTLIGEHSGLFTELMDDIKDMMDSGIITSSEGVVEHLRAMVAESNETDELFGSEDEDEDDDAIEEGDAALVGEGQDDANVSPTTRSERRRQRRVQNEAEMADALNAFAGGASELRPLNEVDEARITSLVELGFDRSKAVAAYLRMGRNVERAANHLFETM